MFNFINKFVDNVINRFISTSLREKKFTNKKILVIIIVIILLIGISIYFIIRNCRDSDNFFGLEELESIELNLENDDSRSNVSSTDSVNEQININLDGNKKIVVHISGEVICPGVITLEEGERIIDAINMADGVTEEADLSKVNLAYVLEDGQKIYIPNVNEDEEKEIIENMEAGIVISGSGTSSESSSSNGNTSNGKQRGNNSNLKININTANVQELQKLSGIGEAIALRIVEYRKENGKFNSIEDLKNVSGIGESKFNKIKNNVFVK